MYRGAPVEDGIAAVHAFCAPNRAKKPAALKGSMARTLSTTSGGTGRSSWGCPQCQLGGRFNSKPSALVIRSGN